MRLPRQILMPDQGYLHMGLALELYGLGKQTVGNAGVLTPANLRSGLLFQDASGGSVTMATRTAAQMVIDFPDWKIGEWIQMWHYSNHATNTSTLNAGAGVTLIGANTVTTTGATYLLVRTGAATFDLVRVS